MVNSGRQEKMRSCHSTRLQRNLAEKQRRYKLNSYISELASIVPMVSMSTKRLDKTSILRLSAAHLRIHQSSLNSCSESSKSVCEPKCNYLDAENVWKILEAIDGFLLITTETGKIIYTSQSVEHFLGHQNIEMIGHSLLSFVHPSDVESVQSHLEKLVSKAMEMKDKSNSGRHSFYCRMRERCQHRSEVVTYQLVHITGHMSTIPHEKNKKVENKCTSLPQINFLLKAFVRLVQTQPYNELSLTDAVEDEYVTRHSLDATIIFSDHRLSTITGHLPHEVFGMSAYHYIYSSDIPVALFAHRLMFTDINGAGLIVYRLRTRNQGKVFLRTTGYLQYDKSSLEVDHFMCVNKLLSDEEGERELKKFIERFTPHIGNSSVKTLYESLHMTQITCVCNPKIKTRLTTEALISNSEKDKENKLTVNHQSVNSQLPAAPDQKTASSEGTFSSYSASASIMYTNRTNHTYNEEYEKLCNRATELVCGMPSSSVLYYDTSSNSSYCTSSESEELQRSNLMEITKCGNSEGYSKNENSNRSRLNQELKASNVSPDNSELSKEEVCSTQPIEFLVASHNESSATSCATTCSTNHVSSYRITKKSHTVEMNDSAGYSDMTSRQSPSDNSKNIQNNVVKYSVTVVSSEKHHIQNQKRPNPDLIYLPHSNHSDDDSQNKSKRRITSAEISPSPVNLSSHSS